MGNDWPNLPGPVSESFSPVMIGVTELRTHGLLPDSLI